jgi:N-acetylmuramoyl-L-alanine amidase
MPASAHCSLDGALGPKETFEVDVNLVIATKLKNRLTDLGADVRMIRTGDDNVDLPDRPKLAKELGGDIFVSVHNNALGDGEDPFAQPRGFQVYYYHRHSRELAARVHDAYVRNIPLPDEGLRYGDYLVARLTWMPAVLTESAYMIIPRQEEQLNTPSFQEQLASTMAEGIVNFFAAPDQQRPQEQPKKTQAQAKKAQQAKAAAQPARTPPEPAKAKVQPKKSAAQPRKVKNAKHS